MKNEKASFKKAKYTVTGIAVGIALLAAIPTVACASKDGGSGCDADTKSGMIADLNEMLSFSTGSAASSAMLIQHQSQSFIVYKSS